MLKFILLSVFLLLLTASAFAQYTSGNTTYQSGAPAGACPSVKQRDVDTTTPALYYCPVPGAGWVKGSGAGGSGTVNSGTAGQIGIYSTTGTAISGDANLTDLTNVLTYTPGSFVLGNATTMGSVKMFGTDGSSVLFSNAGGSTATLTGGFNISGGIQLGTAGGSFIQLENPLYIAGNGNYGTLGNPLISGGGGAGVLDSWALQSIFSNAGATLTLGTVGGNSGSLALAGTTSGSVAWGCSPATTCGSMATSASVIIGKVGQVNSVNTAGNIGVATIQATPGVITIGSGTSIGSTSLCSTTLCPAGTYRVNTYVDITTACGTSGTYIVNLIYTDDQGSKTIPVNINGSGTVPATGTLTTTSTANYGENAQVIRTTGGASINYSTTATACGTAGPMVGNLYLSVDRVQ